VEIGITLKGRKRLVTPERVIDALEGIDPEPMTMYMVDIAGERYPVKQAVCETFGIERTDVGTRDAQRVMERLGFVVTKHPVGVKRRAPKKRLPPPRPQYMDRHVPQDPSRLITRLHIGTIELVWWYTERWENLAGTGPHSDEVELPPAEPGVYRVFGPGSWGPIYIGQSLNLKHRVFHALVRGKALHAAGARIRENEDPKCLRVTWATTDRPAAAEEALLMDFVHEWGRLPKYNG